jgi:hypothetical protein
MTLRPTRRSTPFSALIALVLAWAGIVSVASADVSAQTNLTGSWDLTVDTNQGQGFVVLALTQVGDSISGTYSGTFGSGVQGRGSVEGNQFTMRFPVTDDAGLLGGASGDIVFQGTVEPADTMAGSYDLIDLVVGTFEGTRQAAQPARGGGAPPGG